MPRAPPSVGRPMRSPWPALAPAVQTAKGNAMFLQERGRWAALLSLLGHALSSGVVAVERTWEAFQHREARVEVLSADHARARTIQRELQTTLRCLRSVFGPALPADLTVIAQLSIDEKGQQVSRCDVVAGAFGRWGIVVSLALSVDGSARSTDQLLAALATQVRRLATVDEAEIVDYGPQAARALRGPQEPRAYDPDED